VYENVQVLGDLSVAQFTRLMASITQWVSPEQGCNYCHEGNNLASDNVYTKVVSRRMIQMTQYINAEAKDHVKDTGVTCWTCHRGKNVPEYIWFEGETGYSGMAGWRDGQNEAHPSVGYASLPNDPFSELLETVDYKSIRVQSQNPLPAGSMRNIKDTEKTYGLMMHFSYSLGENCTYCHNSRSWGSWEQSPPTRVSAWHGIQMVRGLNADYLSPLQSEYPANRLGANGDAPKAHCATCHQGVNKPLYGVSMIGDYPSLDGS